MWGLLELHQATVWNPADKDASITISNAGLTIAGGASGFVSARAKQKLAMNCRIYYEFTVNATSDSFGMGIANASASLSTYIGGDSNGASFYAGGAMSYNGGQSFGTLPGAAVSDVWSVAVDQINQKMWVRQNGGGWMNDVIANQNPANATGGLSCPLVFSAPIMVAYTSNNASTEQITINCGSTTFSYTMPAGYAAVNSLATR